MEISWIMIPLVAFAASLLTFFSGFGLGTLLTPVFAIFFPLPQAITLTAVVHLLNNVTKMGLLFKQIHLQTLLQFGVIALLGALAGAQLLNLIKDFSPIYFYSIGSSIFSITWMKFGIGVLIAVFTIIEWNEQRIQHWFKGPGTYIAAFLSGLFGGVSGHQGALRSAFLLRLPLTKEAFIATGTALAVVVDLTRLPWYISAEKGMIQEQIPLLSITLMGSLIGVFLGRRFLKKITLETLKKGVSAFLLFIAFLLISGLI